MAAFFIAPEDTKANIKYHTTIENYNSGIANFLVNTKVGRKIAYLVIRRSTKKKIKKVEKKIKKTFN